MDAKSWSGIVVWSNRDEPFFGRRVTAVLHLDDEGGRLLSDVGLFGSKVGVRFGWAEVKKIPMGKRTTAQILAVAESKGVKVENKTRFAIIMP